MHVGMCAFFQNLDGQHTDREVYIFSYGGMPHDEARRNIRLFAEKVLPRVQALAPRSPFHAA